MEADGTQLEACEEGKDLCGIEIYSDWAEIGDQYHEILRGCMSSKDYVIDTTTSCVTTSAGISGHTRDCIKTCDSDKCNTGTLQIRIHVELGFCSRTSAIGPRAYPGAPWTG